MDKPFIFDFSELIQLEEVYSPESYFLEPFYTFHAKIESLYRYFYINQKTTRQFILESQASYAINKVKDSDATSDVAHSEITLPDTDYHLNFLNSSVLTQLFSIFENTLIEVIELIRNDLKIIEEIPTNGGPIINRYLKWLEQSAGCQVQFDKDTWATLDVLRDVRNSFVHSSIKKTPVQMLKKREELKKKNLEDGLDEHEGYILEAFKLISGAVKIVELGVIKRLEQ
jgi:hypothetical protein